MKSLERVEYRRDVTKTNEEWLGTQDAAAVLGITPRTLYRLINEGAVAAYKLGRVLRLKREDLDAYLESCRVRPGELDHLYPRPRSGEADTE